MWSEGSDSLALVTSRESQAPGTPSGVNYGGFGLSDRRPALNNAGQTAFIAGLTGNGVDSTNDVGIWATDRTRVLQLIARRCDLVDVAPGDFRTVRYFNFSTGSTGKLGSCGRQRDRRRDV